MHSSIAGSRYTCAQSRRFPRLAVALLALALAACGGDSDTQAPLLRSTSPADVATGVPLNARLSAAFDMAMEPLSDVHLHPEAGARAQVAGAVATSTDGTTAIFTPSSAPRR